MLLLMMVQNTESLSEWKKYNYLINWNYQLTIEVVMYCGDTFNEHFTSSVTSHSDEVTVVTLAADTYTFETLTKKEKAIEEIKDQPFF